MSGPVILTRAELEAYRGQGGGRWSGGFLRYYCPIHGSDNQRSLSLNPRTGRFQCFACGAWGYLKEGPHVISELSKGQLEAFSEDPKGRPELEDTLRELQDALPGSLGEKYLEQRGISLDFAIKYGLGYAAPDKWPHKGENGQPIRQWKYGRLVFPHTNPTGEVVNLYGRAVDIGEKAPKEERHDHLPMPKGVFNAKALNSERVFICEGPFDALTLIAAGHENSCAIFGVNGLPWDWVKAQRIVFCFNQDAAGAKWRDLAYEGILRGKDVYFLPQEAYQGYKDLNEAWVTTYKLDIGDWEECSSLRTESSQICRSNSIQLSRNIPEIDAQDRRSPAHESCVVQREMSSWQGWLEGAQVEMVSSLSEWQQAIAKAKAAGLCGLDIETTGLDPLKDKIRLIQLAVPCGEIVNNEGGPAKGGSCQIFIADCMALGQEDVIGPLVAFLADPGVTIVGHNLKFDLAFIRRAAGRRLRMTSIFDTMLASQLANAGYYEIRESEKATGNPLKKIYPEHALKDLAERHLGVALEKSYRGGDWNGGLTAQQVRYAAIDAAVLLPLHGILKELLERNGLAEAAALEFDCIPAVVEVELNGMPFDAVTANKLLEKKIIARDRLKEELAELVTSMGFVPQSARLKKQNSVIKFNPNSSRDVIQCLRFLGCEVNNSREETLRGIADSGCEFARKVVEYRSLEKHISFLKGWLKSQHPADGRIHAKYYQLNPKATGRFSCCSPNLQQVPSRGEDGRIFRRLFKAEPGKKIIKADLSGIELRIIARLSKDTTMMEAFRRGNDLHRMTAAAITGKSPEDVTREERQAAKAVNFGLIYGAGLERLRESARREYGIEMTEEEATEARKAFFDAYPGIAAWHKEQEKLLYRPKSHCFHRHDRGYFTEELVSVRTLGGSKRVWPIHQGKTDTKLTMLFNTPVQGTGACILKAAMGKFYQSLMDQEWDDVKLVATVHDELVVEAPEGLAVEVARRLVAAMEEAGTLFISPVPVKAEVEIGDSWGDGTMTEVGTISPQSCAETC